MKKTGVMKLAFVLKVMVLIVFVSNLLVLLIVPGLVGIQAEGGMKTFSETAPAEAHSPWLLADLFFAVCMQFLWRIWRYGAYCVVLTLFLLLCGVCTAIILWQAKRVLDTILKGEPFAPGNAGNLKRAAVCCLAISGAALARLIWGFAYYRSITPLLTYNALFIPIFLMAGLLCMVMSALFRQAAELKEENDLTI